MFGTNRVTILRCKLGELRIKLGKVLAEESIIFWRVQWRLSHEAFVLLF